MLFGFSDQFLFPQIPVLEKIIRPLIVYVFLLVAFRVFGKRQLGQLTPFDLIVLLTISNVVQNAMIGNDNSLSGGLIGASTILVANFALAYVTYRSRRVERIVEGSPTLLIQNGTMLPENMKKELISEEELRRALVRNGIDPETDLASLKRVELDPDGQITILRKTKLRGEPQT
jgi:uncharacterized membrane protein YcaP (DUF421 family)